MFRKLNKAILLVVTCMIIAVSANAAPKSKTKTKELPPPVAAPETKKEEVAPYFTGFNGYPWGTSVEEILKDTVPKRVIGSGFIDMQNYRTILYKNTSRPVNRQTINFMGFDVYPEFQYLTAAYPKSSKKQYPFACYVVKDGRIIAGAFVYNGDLVNLSSFVDFQVLRIIDYVAENIPRSYKRVNELRNAFNAVLAYETTLSAQDSAGAIQAYVLKGTGLKMNRSECISIKVMSDEYLKLRGMTVVPSEPIKLGIPTL